MISVWRLTDKRMADKSFIGEGSKKYGGRWNSIGVRVVYAAESLALAALELLVHDVDYELLSEYVYIHAEIPKALVQAVDNKNLPKGWRDIPPSKNNQEFGDAWVEKEESAVLKVPSVILPVGDNYIINPAHADFSKIRISEANPFFLDTRLRSERL